MKDQIIEQDEKIIFEVFDFKFVRKTRKYINIVI